MVYVRTLYANLMIIFVLLRTSTYKKYLINIYFKDIGK